jgi:hypothetical protein
MHAWLEQMCDAVQLHQHSARAAAQQRDDKKAGGLIHGLRASLKMFGVGTGSGGDGAAEVSKMGAVVEDAAFDGFFELGSHSH